MEMRLLSGGRVDRLFGMQHVLGDPGTDIRWLSSELSEMWRCASCG